MIVLTAQQMREVDRLTTERYGVPGLQLMENAGAAVAAYICETYPDYAASQILVLCGKGNNGGDGFVVARRLRERGATPRVILFADPSAVRGDAAVNLKTWREDQGELWVVATDAQWQSERSALGEAQIVVDALLGTGLSGPVEGLLAQVIADVNAASCDARARRPQVVSVDIPSGLASDAQDYGGPVIAAHATVALAAPKLGEVISPRADRVGQLVVREIGNPHALLEECGGRGRAEVRWLEPREFRALPLVRKRDANKGTFGHALILAGSLGKSGAAALAGRAALRAGAGLVTVATPLDVLPIVAAGMPELMTAPLASTSAGTASLANLDAGLFFPLLEAKSALAMGPGLSTHAETQQLIRALVTEQISSPLILDADGLNAFAAPGNDLAAHKTSLLAITPHPGEMARLLGTTAADVQARRLEVARDAAERWKAYVILKGFHTILATPGGRVFVNTTGNPGMATGGTGDVLTGMLAGLTAEFGTEQWERVLGLGIYLHGLAGDLAAARVGESPLVASDLIDSLPAAFAHLLAECDRARG